MEYPVSETFTSPQGEGVYTGVMMHFIRLAGCSVGRPYPKSLYQGQGGILPVYTEQCTTWDGRTFPCDTDYRTKRRASELTLVAEIPAKVTHVCITGGEPLIHSLEPLMRAIIESGRWVHLETSGTKPLVFDAEKLWVTVSPKYGVLDTMLARANELKILVDENFKWERLPAMIKTHPRLYIQPINFEHNVKNANLKLCMEIQQENPNVRLSLQLHKVLSDYLGETVR